MHWIGVEGRNVQIGRKKKKKISKPARLPRWVFRIEGSPFSLFFFVVYSNMVITQFVEQIFWCFIKGLFIKGLLQFLYWKKRSNQLEKKKEEVLITKHKTKLQTLMSFSKKYGVSFFYYEYSWLIFVG